MACFHPLVVWIVTDHSVEIGQKFRRVLKFTEPKKLGKSSSVEKSQIPCGQCVGCRLERSRQWAMRCMHEAQMHKQNCFITLTFSPEYLSTRKNEWSLDVRDFQLFMKRLRNRFGKGIRFYHCGEYGEMCSNCDRSLFYCKCGPLMNKVLGRPHYHACIFGFDFPDKEIFRVTDVGNILYTSEILEELWTDPKTDMPMGFCTIGDVTFESAAYCARYIMKKITGDMADDRYFRHDTGEVLKPEYTTMSRRPGIGRTWYDDYFSDVYPHDFVVVDGAKVRPPKYYDGLFKADRPYHFDDIKHLRQENAKKHVDNNSPDRLKVREEVLVELLQLLTRDKEF